MRLRERNSHPLPHLLVVFPALISSRRPHDLNTWNRVVVERAHFPHSPPGWKPPATQVRLTTITLPHKTSFNSRKEWPSLSESVSKEGTNCYSTFLVAASYLRRFTILIINCIQTPLIWTLVAGLTKIWNGKITLIKTAYPPSVGSLESLELSIVCTLNRSVKMVLGCWLWHQCTPARRNAVQTVRKG